MSTKAMKLKNAQKVRRANRVRKAIAAGSARPRLSVFRSLRHMSVQVIDDTKGVTLVSSSDLAIDAKGKKPLEVAALIGADIAKKAVAAGITEVVFDRGSYRYHGRVQALAEAARENGLQF